MLLKSKLTSTLQSMALFLANKDTEYILFKPVKVIILQTFAIIKSILLMVRMMTFATTVTTLMTLTMMVMMTLAMTRMIMVTLTQMMMMVRTTLLERAG